MKPTYDELYAKIEKVYRKTFRKFDLNSFALMSDELLGDEVICEATEIAKKMINDIKTIDLYGFEEKKIREELKDFDSVPKKIKFLNKSLIRANEINNKLNELKLSYKKGIVDLELNCEDVDKNYKEVFISNINEIIIKDIVQYVTRYIDYLDYKGFGVSIDKVNDQFITYIDEVTRIKSIYEAYGDTPTIEKPIQKIQVKGKITDIVRIFEAMREAEITSDKQGEIKKYGQLFDMANFVPQYYSIVSKIKNTKSSSTSDELLKFTKILIEKSFNNKDAELEEIIKHIELIQKKVS